MGSEWTFTCNNGRSNIDHFGMKPNGMRMMRSLTTLEDVWDHCNTSHSVVKLELEGICNKGEVKKGGSSRKRGVPREVRLNKIANVEVWKKYKVKCNDIEKERLKKVSEEVQDAKGVEEGWERMKEGMENM